MYIFAVKKTGVKIEICKDKIGKKIDVIVLKLSHNIEIKLFCFRKGELYLQTIAVSIMV